MSPHLRPLAPVRAGLVQRHGFALVAVLLVCSLIVTLLLSLLALSTHSYEQVAHRRAEEEAKSNARLALDIAIGQLQEKLGPDQRISAPASLLDAAGKPVPNPYWTGVWSTVDDDGQPIIQRDDSTGGLGDRRADGAWDREKKNQGWLVSGSEAAGSTKVPPSPRQALSPSESVPMVSDGSLGAGAPPELKVVAPRVSVKGKRTGHYAYWVGDLGTRANVGTPDAYEDKKPDPERPGDGGFFRLMASQQAETRFMNGGGVSGVAMNAKLKRRLVDDREAQLAAGSRAQLWQPRLFHDLTIHSEGVLADVRQGGLKDDLTAYFLSSGKIPALGDLPGLSDEDRLVGPRNILAALGEGLDWRRLRHRSTSPRFGVLRQWATTGAAFSGRGTQARAPKVETDIRYTDKGALVNSLALANYQPAAIGSFDTPNLMPVLVEGSFYSTLSWHATIPTGGNPNPSYPYQVRIHIYPRVFLCNPYNVELTTPRTMVMIQGNGRREMWTDGIMKNGSSQYGVRSQWIWFEGGRNSDFTPVDNSILNSAGYVDPYMGCFYFSVPSTTFRPGECLVFSPARAAEYGQPGSSLSSGSLDSNELSCEVAPDQSRNYYISNDELDGGITFIPTYYWYAPVTYWAQGGIKNQGDDCRVVWKLLGDHSGITFEDFDNLPQVGIASASLQYGAGREPRISWGPPGENAQNPFKMPVENTDSTQPSTPPDKRTREGVRLRWFREHPSNLAASGAVSPTHFDDSLLGNWNPRAAYAFRTPWDNVAGTLPVTGDVGGPWFFGAYTRDLYDDLVSWQEQMPVYRDGRYHGNPFGPPQLAEDRYILFDVPRKETGVVSLAQFQHVKLSEFVWHPSYAVGQSLVDPRLAGDKAKGVAGTQPPPRGAEDLAVGGYDPSDIGWSNDSQRSTGIEAWAKQGREIFQNYPETDNLVYDLSFEVNHTLWDRFFLSSGGRQDKAAFLTDSLLHPLPNGRMGLVDARRGATTVEDLTDFHRAASCLMVRGAFNVNSTSVEAWKAVLGATRGLGPDGKPRVVFPRVLNPPGGAFTASDQASSEKTWSGFRALDDGEIQRLAEEIVKQVKLRGPFLSLADFVNRRLRDDETGRQGALQAAIEAAGLNQAFLGATYGLDNKHSLGDYNHPDNIRDATRLEQTLKPDSKAWGAPAYLTQGDILQVIGPMLAARSDTFVVRAYGDACDAKGRRISRAWCEAVVQRLPEPVKADQTGLNPRNPGKAGDYGRRFVVTSFQWLKPDEI